MGLFDKKYCSICGEKIGFLSNRKLEDGNLCKNCSAKLSPWFSDRRSSTVEEIREQLAYREENRNAVAALHVTRSYGEDTKVLIDEDAGKFIVTRARNYTDANPDVIDFSQVTGVDLDIDEERSEEYTTDKENKRVSYNPPRYTFSYDFYVVIRVNHRYFDEMRFKLNSSSVETTPSGGVPLVRKPNPILNLTTITKSIRRWVRRSKALSPRRGSVSATRPRQPPRPKWRSPAPSAERRPCRMPTAAANTAAAR